MNWACRCDDFDGYVEFYSSALHKARKEHRCEECNGIIAAGEIYEGAAQKFEGDFTYFKTCMGCLEAARFYKNNNCGCGHPYGNLAEALLEMGQEYPAGKGVRFRAYRLLVKLRRRRTDPHHAWPA